MSTRKASVTFERQDRHGRFVVTARATFNRVPVTSATVEDWRALIERLSSPRPMQRMPA